VYLNQRKKDSWRHLFRKRRPQLEGALGILFSLCFWLGREKLSNTLADRLSASCVGRSAPRAPNLLQLLLALRALLHLQNCMLHEKKMARREKGGHKRFFGTLFWGNNCNCCWCCCCCFCSCCCRGCNFAWEFVVAGWDPYQTRDKWSAQSFYSVWM